MYKIWLWKWTNQRRRKQIFPYSVSALLKILNSEHCGPWLRLRSITCHLWPVPAHCPLMLSQGEILMKMVGKKAIGAGNWWKMRNCLQEARFSLKADILIYNHTILLSQYSSLAAAHKSGCTTSPPDIWSEIGDAIISYFHSPNDTSTNIYYLIVWCGMLWCCQDGLYLPIVVLSWYQVRK